MHRCFVRCRVCSCPVPSLTASMLKISNGFCAEIIQVLFHCWIVRMHN